MKPNQSLLTVELALHLRRSSPSVSHDYFKFAWADASAAYINVKAMIYDKGSYVFFRLCGDGTILQNLPLFLQGEAPRHSRGGEDQRGVCLYNARAWPHRVWQPHCERPLYHATCSVTHQSVVNTDVVGHVVELDQLEAAVLAPLLKALWRAQAV